MTHGTARRFIGPWKCGAQTLVSSAQTNPNLPMTNVTSATVQSANPNDSSLSPDPSKSSTNKNANDKVSVGFVEGQVNTDAKGKQYLQLVLQITADNGMAGTKAPTVALDGSGGITLTATAGTANSTFYVVCNTDGNNTANWTLNVGTSGGSTYKYIKGNGGGGH